MDPTGHIGLCGPAGPPAAGSRGTPGPSGVNLDELHKIVRLMINEELKNATFYTTINDTFVDGLSISYQTGGRRFHIWTYAAGRKEFSFNKEHCPCAASPGTISPHFIGNNYHCESGSHSSPSTQWYMDNPLWDGQGCYSSSRCDKTCQPWFWRKQPILIAKYAGCVPVRIILYNYFGIEQLEICDLIMSSEVFLINNTLV